MKLRRVCGICVHRCCCVLVCFFNLLLVIALCVQGLIAYQLWRDGRVSVPEMARERLANALDAQGLRLSAESIHLDLRGIVQAENVTVGFAESTADALRADELMMQVDWRMLLLGDLRLIRLGLREAELLAPPALSPTGVSQPIIENFSLEINRQGGRISVPYAEARLNNLDVHVRGVLDEAVLAAFPALEAPDEPPKSLHERFRKLVHDAQTLSLQLEPLSGGQLQILLHAPAGDPSTIAVNFHADAYDDGELSGRTIHAFGGLRYEQDVWSWETRPRLSAFDLRQGEFAVKRLVLSARRHPIPDWPAALREVTVLARGLETPWVDVESVALAADLQNPRSIETVWALRKGGSWLSGTLQTSTAMQNVAMTFEAHLRPDDLRSVAEIERMLTEAELVLSPDLRLHGHAAFLDGNWSHGQATLESRALAQGPLEVASLYAQLAIEEKILSAERIRLDVIDGGVVSGRYWQNLATDDYRMNLEGRLNPHALNQLIGEGWWQPFWSQFAFHAAPPHADLDLSGRYGGGSEHKRMLAAVELEDFSYRTVALDRVSAQLFQTGRFLRINHLNVIEGDQKAEAALEFRYVEGSNLKDSIGFAGRGNLAVDDAARIIGPQAEKMAGLFQTDKNPEIVIRGISYKEGSPRDGESFIGAGARFEHPTTFEGIRFDDMAFRVQLDPDRVYIPEADLGLASGRLTGFADFSRTPEGLRIDRSYGALKHALYRELRAAAPIMDQVFGEETDLSGDAEEDPYPGMLNFRGKFTGLVKQPATIAITGGKLAFWQGDLGRINLLGPLSMLLDALGLGITTYELDHIESNFTLHEEILSFPNLVISSPTARIDANGTYNVREDNLDFVATINVLGGVETPLLHEIFSLLDPLSKVIEVNVTGSSSDPDFEILPTPFRILSGQKRIVPEMPDER